MMENHHMMESHHKFSNKKLCNIIIWCCIINKNIQWWMIIIWWFSIILLSYKLYYCHFWDLNWKWFWYAGIGHLGSSLKGALSAGNLLFDLQEIALFSFYWHKIPVFILHRHSLKMLTNYYSQQSTVQHFWFFYYMGGYSSWNNFCTSILIHIICNSKDWTKDDRQ